MPKPKPKQVHWTRTLSPEHREQLNLTIRVNRRSLFSPFAYPIDRGLAAIKRESNFQLGRYISGRLPKRGPLTLLDSGAGLMGVTADLKRLFGKRIFITALGLWSPKVSKTPKRELKKLSEKYKDRRNDLKRAIRKIKDRFSTLRQNAVFADETRVGMAETFVPDRKYDVILDWNGPVTHSIFKERVIQNYLAMLKPNGVILAAYLDLSIFQGFGEVSQFAKEHGFFLEATKIPGASGVTELRVRRTKK